MEESVKAKVISIQINIEGTGEDGVQFFRELNLSMEEIKELRRVLDEILKDDGPKFVPYIPVPYYPSGPAYPSTPYNPSIIITKFTSSNTNSPDTTIKEEGG